MVLARGVHRSGHFGLGLTRNWPDLVELQDGEPTTYHEKPRVESDRAQVDDGRIRLRPKNTNQEPNLAQISQIWKNKSILTNKFTKPNISSPQIQRTQTDLQTQTLVAHKSKEHKQKYREMIADLNFKWLKWREKMAKNQT